MLYPAFLFCLFPILQADAVQEVRLFGGNEAVYLRADGTAERHYRGNWDRIRLEESVGTYTAKLDPREFERLISLPGVIKFDEFQDNRLAFPSKIIHFNVVRDGKTKALQWQDRLLAGDPEMPLDLWVLETAIRGIGTQLNWEPISTGVRVKFPSVSNDVREVTLREIDPNYPVASIRSHRAEVTIPYKPGKYSLEVSTFSEGQWTERKKTLIKIEADGYATVEEE